jgi:hypothetical protein
MDVVRIARGIGLDHLPLGAPLAKAGASALSALFRSLPSRGPWSAVRVDVRSGGGHNLTMGIVDHITNLAPLALVKAVELIATAKGPGPGAYAPESAFDARAFLAELHVRGVRPARLEPLEV